MGVDLESILKAATPQRQEEILEQLDIETAEEFHKKGYGLPTDHYTDTNDSTSRPKPDPPQPSEPQPQPTKLRYSKAARLGLVIVGLIASVLMFGIGLLMILVQPVVGLVLMLLSGGPLAMSIMAPMTDRNP